MRNAWKSKKVHSASSAGDSAANTVGKKMLYASWIIGIYGEKLFTISLPIFVKSGILNKFDKLLL